MPLAFLATWAHLSSCSVSVDQNSQLLFHWAHSSPFPTTCNDYEAKKKVDLVPNSVPGPQACSNVSHLLEKIDFHPDRAASRFVVLGTCPDVSLATTATGDEWHKSHFCQVFTPPIFCELFLDGSVQPRLSCSAPANSWKKGLIVSETVEFYLPKCMIPARGNPKNSGVCRGSLVQQKLRGKRELLDLLELPLLWKGFCLKRWVIPCTAAPGGYFRNRLIGFVEFFPGWAPSPSFSSTETKCL